MKTLFYKNTNLPGLAALVLTAAIFLLLLLSSWYNRAHAETIVYNNEIKLYYPIAYGRCASQTETLAKQCMEKIKGGDYGRTR